MKGKGKAISSKDPKKQPQPTTGVTEAHSDASHQQTQRRSLAVFDDLQEAQINPFMNNTIYLTQRERVKMSILAVTILPFRMVLLVSSLLAAALVCRVATIGWKGSNNQPLPTWRRWIRKPSILFIRGMLFSLGFHYIPIRGKPAKSKDAGLILCNHNSIFDPLVLVTLAPASAVSKHEVKKTPLFSSIAKAYQAIFVDRLQSESRHSTMDAIRTRTKDSRWDRIMIFPEGTCTNGTGLITFKAGAFTPGVNVQPVCIKYHWKHCDPVCVKHGPQPLFMMFKLMCQFQNFVSVDFLPVYVPSEEEKKNANFFSLNVRDVMAKHLKQPTTDHSFDDVVVQLYGKKLGEPMEKVLLEIKKLQKFLDLNIDSIKEYLEQFAALDTSKTGRLTLEQFANKFRTEISPQVRNLFETMDHDHDGTLDFRDFLIGSAMMNDKGSGRIKDTLRLAFKVFDVEDRGYLTRTQLAVILRKVYPEMTDSKVDSYFQEADRQKKEKVDVDDFIAFAEKYENKIKLFRAALF
eukprot:c8876_g1_i1.p1 GENE.c8876_g1_i1~~c8876_g1_i1.p1  ORF type:complete len:519 (+),score=147.88 c8876_g1_i1:269-1825(+)